MSISRGHFSREKIAPAAAFTAPSVRRPKCLIVVKHQKLRIVILDHMRNFCLNRYLRWPYGVPPVALRGKGDYYLVGSTDNCKAWGHSFPYSCGGQTYLVLAKPPGPPAPPPGGPRAPGGPGGHPRLRPRPLNTQCQAKPPTTICSLLQRHTLRTGTSLAEATEQATLLG